MDVKGCGLLSVSDATVRCAAVSAGLLLLIFPCSLCWLMVHIGSEAEKRCGLNVVTLHPGFSPCCALSLSQSFFLPHSLLLPLSIFSLFVNTISVHLPSLPHFVAYLSFPLSILLPHRLLQLQWRENNRLKGGENLMNSPNGTVRLLAWSELETVLVLGWPLIVNFTFQTLDLLWWVSTAADRL